jgi:hypothetical protein
LQPFFPALRLMSISLPQLGRQQFALAEQLPQITHLNHHLSPRYSQSLHRQHSQRRLVNTASI